MVSGSRKDTEGEEETRISNLEMSNKDNEKVVKRGAKKGPSDQVPEIHNFRSKPY